ncbi:hypothetical protein ACJA23_02510 [Mycoplasma corogypsi]|uniref:hypothetical protein n=1 Tax=Mycoplasma corogypsi TaxID=2106 RepID=UPI0038738A43
MYKAKDVAFGKVTRTGQKYITVETKEGALFTIKKNEISDNKRHRINDLIKLKDSINFIVISYEIESKTGFGSFKKNHPNYQDNPFKYFLKETPGGFDQLITYIKYHISKLEDLKNNSK